MSERDLDDSMEGAVQAGTVYPAFLYEGEFIDTGTGDPVYLRLWTGVYTLSWDSKSWLGGGRLLMVSPPEETREVKATGFSVAMAGIANADVTRALAAVRPGRPGKIWFATCDAQGQLEGEPYQLAEGKLDINVIETSGSGSTISVQYEGELVRLQEPSMRRYTGEDQKLVYPDDTGFDNVQALQDMQLIWRPVDPGTAPA